MTYKLLGCLFLIHLSISQAVASNNISLKALEKSSQIKRSSAYFDDKDLAKAEKRIAKYDINLDVALKNFSGLLVSQRLERDKSNAQILLEIWKNSLNYNTEKASKVRKLYEKTWSLLVIAKEDRLIDDIEFRSLLEELRYTLQYPYRRESRPGPRARITRHKKYGPALIQLKDYYRKLKRIRKYRLDSYSENELYLPIRKANFKAPNKERYTLREKLYAAYSPIQIKAMASLLSYMFDIMMAQRTYTTIEMDNREDIVLEATLTDQYRLAIRLYEREKRIAEQTRTKIGRAVDDVDIVFAALELGVITSEEVSLLLTNPDFYQPGISLEKKIGNYIKNLAMLGLQLNPATAPYVLLPTLLYKSIKSSKESLKAADEDLFLFTLPGN